MNEVRGRGFYPGPGEQSASNKTDHGNAVWRPLHLASTRNTTQHRNTGDHQDKQ
jgi:hypothetical protein